MANNQQLEPGVDVADPAASGGMAYPSTVVFFQLKGDQGNIHLIWTNTAITPSSTVLANAPNGSLCFAMAGSKIWIKQGAFGLTNGTWVGVAVS